MHNEEWEASVPSPTTGTADAPHAWLLPYSLYNLHNPDLIASLQQTQKVDAITILNNEQEVNN